MNPTDRVRYLSSLAEAPTDKTRPTWLGVTLSYVGEKSVDAATGTYQAFCPLDVVAALELTLDQEIDVLSMSTITGTWTTVTMTLAIADRLATAIIYELPSPPPDSERNTLFIGQNALMAKTYWSVDDIMSHVFLAGAE